MKIISFLKNIPETVQHKIYDLGYTEIVEAPDEFKTSIEEYKNDSNESKINHIVERVGNVQTWLNRQISIVPVTILYDNDISPMGFIFSHTLKKYPCIKKYVNIEKSAFRCIYVNVNCEWPAKF